MMTFAEWLLMELEARPVWVRPLIPLLAFLIALYLAYGWGMDEYDDESR